MILQTFARKSNGRAPKANSDTNAFFVSRELIPLTFPFSEERKYHVLPLSNYSPDNITLPVYTTKEHEDTGRK